MVITQKKELDEILDSISGTDNIVLLGCSECAAVCKTGGEEEVAELAAELSSRGKNILGSKVLSTSCNLLLTKKELKELKESLKDCDTVISLACGNGVQTVTDLIEKSIIPANNTLFVGEKLRTGIFEENCRTCGECVLGRTAAICPVTKCAKGLLNGPCGGSKFGKCEVNSDNDCAWIEIYSRLDELGKLDLLYEIQPIRSYENSSSQRTVNFRNKHKSQKIKN